MGSVAQWLERDLFPPFACVRAAGQRLSLSLTRLEVRVLPLSAKSELKYKQNAGSGRRVWVILSR